MATIDFLKQRYSQAKKFTEKEFLDMAEKAVKDYDAKDDFSDGDINLLSNAVQKRYEFVIPMIFTNTESIKATAFEKIPDVMFNGRGEGQEDDVKKQKVEAAYKYIADKVDLENFMFDTFHWFVLLGFCSGHSSFKNESKQIQAVDEVGQSIFNDDGTPVMTEAYVYNDPILEVGDPFKEFYSPDSEFSIDSGKIPYYFRKKPITKEEIKKIYGIEVEPDSVVDYVEKDQSKSNADNKRCTLFFYYGDVCEENSKEVNSEGEPWFTNWEEGKMYLVLYAGDKILYVEEKDTKDDRIGRWYGHPNKFFGYGLGKVGRQFQKEKSIRRGQQIRMADVAAFPKLIINNTGKTKIDPNTMLDPRENLLVSYEGEQEPKYLQPGNLAPIVTANAEQADQDAQQAFGIMDISTGAQNSSTVDTATGQTIFAEAAQKRVSFAKKRYLKFIKSIIILLLTLARDNWDEDKLVSITDEEGVTTDVTVNANDLKDVDFEKDIVIDFENVSVNKDIVRQQYISLYDKTKDDPIIDRAVLLKDVMRKGFDVKNPEKYIKKPSAAPGTVLTSQDGQQFTVGEGGELVSQEDMNQMGSPSNEQVISNQPTL